MLCCGRFSVPELPVLRRTFLLVSPQWPAERRMTPSYKRSAFDSFPYLSIFEWTVLLNLPETLTFFPPFFFVARCVPCQKSFRQAVFIPGNQNLLKLCVLFLGYFKVAVVVCDPKMFPVTVSSATRPHELRRHPAFNSQNQTQAAKGEGFFFSSPFALSLLPIINLPIIHFAFCSNHQSRNTHKPSSSC